MVSCLKLVVGGHHEESTRARLVRGNTVLWVGYSGQVSTSNIAGIVRDESGSAVPLAKISVVATATRQQRDTVSNEAGEFVVPQLSPGIYRVTATAPGFQTTVVESLTLNIAERATLELVLKLGQVSEQVTVEATSPLLEQETASLGQTITRKAINDLPLNGRNYITLGALPRE